MKVKQPQHQGTTWATLFQLPGVDDLQTYQQNVELLTSIWPSGKMSELVARLILNSKGSAFAKLQLHQKELLNNDPKSVNAW